MEVYIYQAALLCPDCGNKTRDNLNAAFKENGSKPGSEADDSDRFPQGLYPDGGGEADAPQYCDHCGVHLENPLTADGAEYVFNALREHVETGRGDLETLKTWADFYGDDYADGDDDDSTLAKFRGYVAGYEAGLTATPPLAAVPDCASRGTWQAFEYARTDTGEIVTGVQNETRSLVICTGGAYCTPGPNFRPGDVAENRANARLIAEAVNQALAAAHPDN